MLSLALGLGSGLCWGVADFFGGLQSRRLPSLAVALWSQIAGTVALAIILTVVGGTPTAEGIGWGAVAGVFGGLGLAFFYRGLAVGLMSIVAPIAACGAVVPVAVALALGEPPAPIALAGICAALVGVVLASSPDGAAEPSRKDADAVTGDGLPVTAQMNLALLLALCAALCFGLFFVFLDLGAATSTPPLWIVGGARLGSLPTLVAVALLTRASVPYPAGRMPAVALIGVADTTANVLFTYATVEGNLGVVSVLGSLYPLATIALARVLLHERLARMQAIGVTCALAGVALIAAG